MKNMLYKQERVKEILYSGEYKGRKFAIVSLGTHPCAYVSITENDKNTDSSKEVLVHGGLTYIGPAHWNTTYTDSNEYIGWDYAHAGDYWAGFDIGITFVGEISYLNGKKWTTQEIFDEVKQVIEQLNKRIGDDK